MALWSRFFGSAGSQAVGIGLGTTAVPALLPAAQYLVNQAWHKYPDAPLLAAQVAIGVAQGQIDPEWGKNEARINGLNETRWDALVRAADTGPGVAQAFELWRRDEIDEAGFRRAAKRAAIEDEWIDALVKTKPNLLTPAQIALGIVRSIIPDPGFLPVTLNTAGGNVPGYAPADINAVTEAAGAGISSERLRVMVGEIGRPMAPESAASSVFRNIINRADYNRAILEGDIRPEWADAIFEHARAIPSVADYVNAHIRGWITEAEMHAGAARHGMSTADVDLLYLRTGRPAAPGQMATAAARGIDGPDGRPMDREQFLKGIKESDIRPEWGPMLWDARFLYPPLFQITRLVQAKAITPETARDWAVKDRYPPEVVNVLYTYWSKPAAETADTHVAKARTQLWGALHRSYLAGDTDDTTALEKLGVVGVPSAERADVLAVWKNEAELIRLRMTTAQVKKAWVKAVTNYVTNAPWTREDALTELVQRGWSAPDANAYLDE